MSAKSKKPSRRIDRPFDPALFRRARKIADNYQIVIQSEDGEYYGRGLEMPFIMSDGKTPDECVRATRDALTAAVAYLLESGKTPPIAATENARNEQVNIRLTTEEKLLLEEAARSKGFRGISDYVRNASLSNLR